MSLLPGQILPQSVPFGRADTKGQLYIDHNWYLFLYNLSLQVLSGMGSVPTSQADLIDMVDLDAEGADLPQAYRKIVNLQALNDALDETGSDVARLNLSITNITQLLPIEDRSVTLREMANALILASDSLLQDPPPPSGPVIPITPGSSPFTYTAIHDGTICISGPPSATINVIRYGVTVPTGMTDGAIPVRKNDQVYISWSGGTAPVMNFLPNK